MALTLNEDWTADVAGKMHKYRITGRELADRCVYRTMDDGSTKSYHPQYISTVLNGKKEFETEESAERTKKRILEALNELIAERISEANESDHAGSDGD